MEYEIRVSLTTKICKENKGKIEWEPGVLLKHINSSQCMNLVWIPVQADWHRCNRQSGKHEHWLVFKITEMLLITAEAEWGPHRVHYTFLLDLVYVSNSYNKNVILTVLYQVRHQAKSPLLLQEAHLQFKKKKNQVSLIVQEFVNSNCEAICLSEV